MQNVSLSCIARYSILDAFYHMMLFPILMGYLVLDTVFLAAAFLLVGLSVKETRGQPINGTLKQAIPG